MEGRVPKCNMCVDRLEEGLKPACVSACLGNALEFGVIENAPKNRDQVLTQLPGFPDPEITHPNIRFQQIKALPNEVTRTDSMPIKYNKDRSGRFRSVVDQKVGKEKQWNLHRLSSRENPLVFFTLSTQTVVGAFSWHFLASLLSVSWPSIASPFSYATFLLTLIVLQSIGLVLSTIHLGKPLRFYRGFNNLQHSPLSREALVVFEWLKQAAGVMALVAGIAGLWFMTKIYRIRARPFWNHWQVTTSFFGSTLSLGGLLFI